MVAFQVRAADADVYWDSFFGFSQGSVTINAGDYVNIINTEDEFGEGLTVYGDPPEYFAVYIQPDYYYYPHQYNNPGTFTFEDQYSETVWVYVNALLPLSVAITDPTNNTVFTAPATFTITAEPSGGATPYSWVDFYVGTNLIGYTFDAPYTNAVTNLPAGTYTVTAVVVDDSFNEATNAITVIVNSAAPVLLSVPRSSGNQFLFDVNGLTAGKTNILQTSTNFTSWTSLKTNVAVTSSMTFTNTTGSGSHFFRVLQLP